MQNKVLKCMRVLRGYRQRELAKQVGRSQPWLSLVEQAKLEPQHEEARKLAKILQIDEEILFPE